MIVTGCAAPDRKEQAMAEDGPEITWYFDTVSPFSYLALPTVEALAARRAVALRPVVLGALLVHWGTVGPAEVAPKRLHTYRLCQYLADRAGVPMRFPPRHPFRSLESLRLLTALGAPLPAVRTAFDFVWREGRDPSDPAEFAALRGRFPGRDGLDLDGAKAALREATEAAIAAGVFGVPTLRIGAELFWGVGAIPMAEAYLEDRSILGRGEMGRLADLAYGVEPRRR
jgi:2-hydroxychromene-2-carboxylate isomerase